jgi:hypothetical protein
VLEGGLDRLAVRPGSIQGCAVNAGDPVFFEIDSTDLTSGCPRNPRQASPLARAHLPPTPSSLKMRTSAAHANIILVLRPAPADGSRLPDVPRGSWPVLSHGRVGQWPPSRCLHDISCWSQTVEA